MALQKTIKIHLLNTEPIVKYHPSFKWIHSNNKKANIHLTTDYLITMSYHTQHAGKDTMKKMKEGKALI